MLKDGVVITTSMIKRYAKDEFNLQNAIDISANRLFDPSYKKHVNAKKRGFMYCEGKEAGKYGEPSGIVDLTNSPLLLGDIVNVYYGGRMRGTYAVCCIESETCLVNDKSRLRPSTFKFCKTGKISVVRSLPWYEVKGEACGVEYYGTVYDHENAITVTR